MAENEVTYPRIAAREAFAGGTFAKLLDRIREYEPYLPAAAWVSDPLWHEAKWTATSYQFDGGGDFPPVMGLAFENCEKGRQLFKNWTGKNGNCDELEEIRITVIEGDIPGDKPGYFGRIGCDSENSMIRATAMGIAIDELPLSVLGQMQRMCPIIGATPMLPRFKELFRKHEEFLFAPVSLRGDGKRWVDLECGIVKQTIHFRAIGEIERELAQRIDKLAGQFGNSL
jgi:hypothetical protein